jgi:hypothetical protein
MIALMRNAALGGVRVRHEFSFSIPALDHYILSGETYAKTFAK